MVGVVCGFGVGVFVESVVVVYEEGTIYGA